MFTQLLTTKKLSTFWDTGFSKSIISRACLKKLGNREELQPCTDIQLLFVSGNKLEPIAYITLDIKLGIPQVKHAFVVCKYLTQCPILVLDFCHKLRITTDWNKDGKLFLHKNGKLVYIRRKIHQIS